MYYKKSDYKKAQKEIMQIYNANSNNLYIAILYAKILADQHKFDEGLSVLNKIENICPHNTIISFTISEILIENNLNLSYAEKLVMSLKDYYKMNPDFLRLASKLHTLRNNKYEAALSLSQYYELLDNIDLAIEVLDNSIRSEKMNAAQKRILLSKKNRIICDNPRRLEPIFGEKDCY